LGTPPTNLQGWLWLFPASYAVHVLEEGLAGERFHRWIRHATGRTLNPGAFWAVNGVLWAMMVGAVLAARNHGALDWIVTALGTLVAVNGAGHIVGTLFTGTYSPGLFTGGLLWLPLGLSVLWKAWQAGSRVSFATGVVLGLVVQAGVASLAFALSHRTAGRGGRAWPQLRR